MHVLVTDIRSGGNCGLSTKKNTDVVVCCFEQGNELVLSIPEFTKQLKFLKNLGNGSSSPPSDMATRSQKGTEK